MTLLILLSYGCLAFALGWAARSLVASWERQVEQTPPEPPEPPPAVRLLPVSLAPLFDWEREAVA